MKFDYALCRMGVIFRAIILQIKMPGQSTLQFRVEGNGLET